MRFKKVTGATGSEQWLNVRCGYLEEYLRQGLEEETFVRLTARLDREKPRLRAYRWGVKMAERAGERA